MTKGAELPPVPPPWPGSYHCTVSGMLPEVLESALESLMKVLEAALESLMKVLEAALEAVLDMEASS